ncbi:hypothetical protein ACLK11_00960 [Escherichia coli]
MAAIVGAAGLLPTLAAIRAGKTILLANKESLAACRTSVYGRRKAEQSAIVTGR